MKAQELINSMIEDKKSASDVLEVEVMKDAGNGTTLKMVDKKSADARAAVEKHLKALGADLEKMDLTFNARIEDGYASVSWR